MWILTPCVRHRFMMLKLVCFIVIGLIFYEKTVDTGSLHGNFQWVCKLVVWWGTPYCYFQQLPHFQYQHENKIRHSLKIESFPRDFRHPTSFSLWGMLKRKVYRNKPHFLWCRQLNYLNSHPPRYIRSKFNLIITMTLNSITRYLGTRVIRRRCTNKKALANY